MNSRKIVILGGNPETGAIVDVANKMGLQTIVIDPFPQSPAKKHASVSYDLDVTKTEEVNKIIKKENVHAVLVGVADPLVPYYVKICEDNGFPCYANNKIIKYLSSKKRFADFCLINDINIIPSYSGTVKADDLEYPVIVKPTDSGAGVGISVCHSSEELNPAIEKALSNSIKKEFVIEKFMECDDMFAYYTFIDGNAYLSALADRNKTKKQGNFSSVCISADYPSKHTQRFVEETHPKLLKMFNELGILNGVLMLQFFVDEKGFYAYDPGFRLQGEAPHIYLKHFNKFDQREMLINYALTGSMYEGNEFAEKNNYLFNENLAVTLWVLLKSGEIAEIHGLEEVKSHPDVITVLQRFHVGDFVTEAMLGTERQVFCRIYIEGKTREQIVKTVKFIRNELKIFDKSRENMILDSWDEIYEK